MKNVKNNLAVIILAAGEGTRMKSQIPKALHLLSGKPLISWILSSVYGLKPTKIVLVVGHKAEKIKEELSKEDIIFVEQKKQLGSADALKSAQKLLNNFSGNMVVICVDTPLISTATLKAFFRVHLISQNAATILSARLKNPHSYGRILRSISGEVEGIVEEKDANLEQRKIAEVNSGIYCFRSPLAWSIISKIRNENKKKEYYLTDAISILKNLKERVGAYCIDTAEEMSGINSRIDLANAEKTVRKKVLSELMLSGVTVIDPENTYVSPEVKIGQDTVIYPGTIIEGKTVIGNNNILGPNSYIRDSDIGNDTQIRNSYVTGSKIEDKVKIGPFSNVRPGSVIKEGSRVGNFSEIKNSVLSEESKVNHLSYIGDTFLGKKVNVGAGTITCNYDGKNKNKTYVGDRVFIGSNVNLIAPVKIGADVVLGAGSTITDDVPSQTLAIARARQVHKKRK